jgi:hypothetical protein
VREGQDRRRRCEDASQGACSLAPRVLGGQGLSAARTRRRGRHRALYREQEPRSPPLSATASKGSAPSNRSFSARGSGKAWWPPRRPSTAPPEVR